MDVKDAVCAVCERNIVEGKERLEISAQRSVRKYIYVLPSGRKIKVVVDDEVDMVRSAA